MTGRNVAVPQKLPRPNCSWMTDNSEVILQQSIPTSTESGTPQPPRDYYSMRT